MSDVVTERKKWPADGDPRGLECPECGCRRFHVRTTRNGNRMIIRYRQCHHCGRRMTTCERAVVG